MRPEGPTPAHQRPPRGRRPARLAVAGLWLMVLGGMLPNPVGAQGQVLRVVMRLSPASHLPYRDFPLTLEDALVQRFTAYLQADLKIRTADDAREALSRLGESADMAALGTLPQADLQATALPGPAFLEIHPRVVYCAGNRRPDRLDSLKSASVRVGAGTWHEDLAHTAGLAPQIAHAGRDIPARLRDLVRTRTGYALGDQHELLLLQRVLPGLRPVLGFGENGQLRWWFADTPRGRRLRERAEDFFTDLRASGELDRLIDAHLAHVYDFNPGAAVTFMERVRKRLPRFLPLFREGAKRSGLDWHLLAAVAYQESHWDPKAVSPTGVRGLMMLTEDTAQQMAVDDRVHPGKSLHAGAAYLLRVKRKIPSRIPEPDRTWMMLAAYNLGFGHLEDARILAQRAGASPDRWLEVRPYLFRLDDPGCEQLKRGCYKGGEGAVYVRRIRNYLEALVWLDASGWLWEIPALAALRASDT